MFKKIQSKSSVPRALAAHKKQLKAAGYGARRRMCGGAWASGESYQQWRDKQPIKRRGPRRAPKAKSKKVSHSPDIKLDNKKGSLTIVKSPGISGRTRHELDKVLKELRTGRLKGKMGF